MQSSRQKFELVVRHGNILANGWLDSNRQTSNIVTFGNKRILGLDDLHLNECIFVDLHKKAN